MKKYTPIPLDQSDEFKLVADHGKFMIAYDIEDQNYHVWTRAPRKRHYCGLKHRGVVWGIVESGQGTWATLTHAEQDVCRRLREEVACQ